MFDAKYYADKKNKLTQRYVVKMEEVIKDTGDLLNKFFAEKQSLVEEMAEIGKMEKENGVTDEEVKEEVKE